MRRCPLGLRRARNRALRFTAASKNTFRGRFPGNDRALVSPREGRAGTGGGTEPPGPCAALVAGLAEEPRVLSHKDMCLVFCAFASWAVKTSDLQAPDAWKTSTYSARLDWAGRAPGDAWHAGKQRYLYRGGKHGVFLLFQSPFRACSLL